MRVVASMTTTPSRIDRIRPAIASVLAQSVPVEHLEMNIPYVCRRTGESYVVPPWLEAMERVRIFRTEDYGPITKVAPTLVRYHGDPLTCVWSADDDIAYPANQLAMLLRCQCPSQRRILARHGGFFQPDGGITFMVGKLEVSMFEGFGTVLYPPGCVGEDFLDYVSTTSENEDCRRSDDVVLSFYFLSRLVPIFLCNRPSDGEPFYPTWLPHAWESDALTRQDGGHIERYKRVFQFLRSRATECPAR